jgi:copper chaperone CopZ
MKTVLSVPDMHCDNCVARITKAFSKESILFLPNLTDKTVLVYGDECIVQRAIDILDDLGFDASIIN